MQTRKRNRHAQWDYSTPGGYFVTICVRDIGNNGDCPVGVRHAWSLQDNPYNDIINQCWNEIPEHYPNVVLDEYVIMPDHFHGIVIITVGDGVSDVGVGHARPLRRINKRPIRHRTNKQPIRLSDIIGSFKSAVSKKIHESGNSEFHWQRSFHDRIIRDEEELKRIRIYIRNNPLNIEE